jgi:hypothetical protein
MRVSLAGVGSETLLEDFSVAGIQYTRCTPEPGQIRNAGEWVEIAKAAPWAAVAAVLVAWIKARSSRKVIITTLDNKIFHAEGMSVEEIKSLLPVTKSIAALETKKLDPPKE